MRFSVVVLAALTTLGTAGASWVDHGQSEPSMPHDTPDVMWPDAPGEAQGRAYFNAYPSASWTSANPNVAALGTRVFLPLTEWEATLGVWADCNGDGVIGLAESAAAEYASLLLDAAGLARCPPGSPHHQGAWVTELLAIGPADGRSANPTVLDSPRARVWGDQVRYGELGCRTWPLAPGSTSRTGVLVGKLDCHVGGALVGTVNELDPDGELGLRMTYPPWRSDSALNRDLPVHPYENPWTGDTGFWEDDSGNAAFTVYDCSTDGGPTPALHDAEGSAWDGVENAWDGAMEDCDPQTRSFADELHVDLEPRMMVDPAPRQKTDMVFRFYEGRRAAGGPPDAGLSAAREWFGPSWRAANYWLYENNVVHRHHLALREAQTWRFYAYLDLDAPDLQGVALPGGGATRLYGDDYCPWYGGEEWWDCDPDNWYWDIGIPEAQGYPRPGDPYHLGDTDCHDFGAGLLLATAGPLKHLRKCGEP